MGAQTLSLTMLCCMQKGGGSLSCTNPSGRIAPQIVTQLWFEPKFAPAVNAGLCSLLDNVSSWLRSRRWLWLSWHGCGRRTPGFCGC
jgi:hypothetical protein